MSGKGFKWLAVPVAALVVATVAWWWLRKTSPANPSATAGPQSVPSTIQSSSTATESKSTPAQLLQSAAGNLAAAQSADGKKQALARLREALATGSTNELPAAIRQFLNAKTDAATGQGFKIGGNGSLLEAPTLRAFLLDELGRLDPVAAAEYAKIILASKDSPDEWAVALRSLARGDASAEGRALLEQKTGELMRYEPWQREPSVGFLEAFDVAVFVGGTDLLPTLSDLIRRKDNQAVAHAAFLTLDRLVINDAPTTLGVLAGDPSLMEGREETRANYFARADVGDSRQRQVLESYLLDPRISADELQKFAGLYPNANFMISPNLLTQTTTPDREALTQRDATSLRVAQEWLTDPRFAKLRPELEKVTLRLQEFVRQADQHP